MAYLTKEMKEFALKVGFIKDKFNFKDKNGFIISDKEIIDYFEEIKRIKNNEKDN